MPPPPALSGRAVARAFEAMGWQQVRVRGSHIIMTKSGMLATLSIPDHREVAKGTLRALIRAAEITVDQFVQAADR